MKKTYVKPMVAFENFQMTSSVAGTCKSIATTTDGNTCVYVAGNGWVYFNMNTTCTTPYNESFCYHVPTEDTTVFAS